jgi:hypothetical protein
VLGQVFRRAFNHSFLVDLVKLYVAVTFIEEKSNGFRNTTPSGPVLEDADRADGAS